jgi:hypothetical protein
MEEERLAIVRSHTSTKPGKKSNVSGNAMSMVLTDFKTQFGVENDSA